MDGNDGPVCVRPTTIWDPSAAAESGCDLFRVVWLGVVDELCGNADEFEDDMDATAFDLNDASMEAKSLIFHLHRVDGSPGICLLWQWLCAPSVHRRCLAWSQCHFCF